MPKSLEKTHRLIQRMDKGDRSSFEQTIGSKQKQNITILYRLLKSFALFDREEICRHFCESPERYEQDKKKVNTTISKINNRLYDLLLFSLRVPSEKDTTTPYNQVDGLLAETKILMQFGLINDTFKCLQEAKKKAEYYGFTLLLISLIEEEISIYIKFSDRVESQKLTKLYFRLKSLINEKHQLIDLEEVKRKLLLFNRQRQNLTDVERKEWKQRLSMDFSAFNPEQFNTFETQHAYYQLAGNFYLAASNFPASSQNFEKSYLLWLTHTEKIKYRFINFIKVVNNHLSLLYYLRDLDKYKEVLDLLWSLKKPKSKVDRAELESCHYASLFTYYMLTGEIQKGLDLVERVEAALEELGEYMAKPFQISIPFNLAVICLLGEETEKSYTYLNKVLAQLHVGKNEGRNHQNLNISLYFLQALISLDEYLFGDIQDGRLDTLTRALQQNIHQYLENHNALDEISETAIQLMWAIFNAVPGDRSILIKEMAQTLYPFIQDKKEHPARPIILWTWAEARTTGRKMYDVYRDFVNGQERDKS